MYCNRNPVVENTKGHIEVITRVCHMSLTFVYHGEKRQPVQHIVHFKDPEHQITVRSAAAECCPVTRLVRRARESNGDGAGHFRDCGHGH